MQMETITDDKQLCASIGAYIAHFNSLEMMLQGAFEKALAGDGTWADCILHHVQSISVRLDMTEDFIKTCRKDTEIARVFIPLIPDIRDAVTFRNQIVHAVYTIDSDGNGVTMAHNLFFRKKKFRQEAISAQIVAQKFKELDALLVKLAMGVGGSYLAS